MALKEKEQADLGEMIRLQEELQYTREKYGIETKEGRISRMVSRHFEREAGRERQPVSRRKYLWLAALTGWFGGHRFYARRYFSAVLYLLFFWSGFPIAMSIIDILAAIPMKADENGMICL